LTTAVQKIFWFCDVAKNEGACPHFWWTFIFDVAAWLRLREVNECGMQCWMWEAFQQVAHFAAYAYSLLF
jgi:hypothetical protein